MTALLSIVLSSIILGIPCTDAALRCHDWKGDIVSEGFRYVPNVENPCRTCLCENGFHTACQSVSCSPGKCEKYKKAVPIKGECCLFQCVNENLSGQPNWDGTNFTDPDGPITVNQGHSVNFSLRLISSVVTTFLIIAILVFMVHRLRQRRILIMLRRARQDEEDDQLESSRMDWINIAMTGPYGEPPPPYTPPKPADVIASPLSPPSYEDVASYSPSDVVLQPNGSTVHHNGRIRNGNNAVPPLDNSSATQNATMTSASHNDDALIEAAASSTSMNPEVAQGQAHVTKIAPVYKRCKHSRAKKNRHSVGNQTENVAPLYPRDLMSTSFTQGVGVSGYVPGDVGTSGDNNDRHTLPKHLTNRNAAAVSSAVTQLRSRDQHVGEDLTLRSAMCCVTADTSSNNSEAFPSLTPDTKQKEANNFRDVISELKCTCDENKDMSRSIASNDTKESNSQLEMDFDEIMDDKQVNDVMKYVRKLEHKNGKRPISNGLQMADVKDVNPSNHFVGDIHIKPLQPQPFPAIRNGLREGSNNSEVADDNSDRQYSPDRTRDFVGKDISSKLNSDCIGRDLHSTQDGVTGQKQNGGIEKHSNRISNGASLHPQITIDHNSHNRLRKDERFRHDSSETKRICHDSSETKRIRHDSSETKRRLSMANEGDNTYTKYGFLDNPHSIETADVILRDKRIRSRNALEIERHVRNGGEAHVIDSTVIY